MSILSRKPHPAPSAPKDDTVSVVQSTMDEVNTLQREMYRRLRNGERPSSISMVLLNHRQSELLKTLIHDIGVTPVISDQTGLWYLYEGRA